MMDIGLAPRQTHFSRAEFPVKYYLLDISTAVRLRVNATAHPSCPPLFSGSRGRSKNTVLLSASRPRVSSIVSDPFIGSLVEQTPSMKLALTLACARARSDSDMTLVSSGFDTPDPHPLDVVPPKQTHFFSRPSSPDRLSDPEPESGSEEGSSDEERQTVWVVPSATRISLFAGDLKSLSRMLEDAVQLVYSSVLCRTFLIFICYFPG